MTPLIAGNDHCKAKTVKGAFVLEDGTVELPYSWNLPCPVAADKTIIDLRQQIEGQRLHADELDRKQCRLEGDDEEVPAKPFKTASMPRSMASAKWKSISWCGSLPESSAVNLKRWRRWGRSPRAPSCWTSRAERPSTIPSGRSACSTSWTAGRRA